MRSFLKSDVLDKLKEKLRSFLEGVEETIEEKNERRTKEIAEENERVLAREKSVREITENMQEVIVEKPRGFWDWLKSLFT